MRPHTAFGRVNSSSIRTHGSEPLKRCAAVAIEHSRRLCDLTPQSRQEWQERIVNGLVELAQPPKTACTGMSIRPNRMKEC